MANDLNQCNFIGRLGGDPEIRYLPSGGAVCSMSIAVGESWRNKQTGQKEERTEWVNLSVFGKMAEVCAEYLRKGSKIFVSCKMKTEKWQDQSGQDRYTTKMIVQNMQMLDSAPQGNWQNGGQGQHQGGWGKPQQPARQPASQQSQPQQRQPAQLQYNEPPMDFDDDIPFAPIGLQHRKLLNTI